MSIPPVDYGEVFDDAIDPLLLERQRRRYASRAIAYLVLLNGVAAVILLANLPQLAGQVSKPTRIVDAMLVFGAGAAVALGSTFFAYMRRTVRLQAPARVPLRVSLWWLSVLAAIAAAACFLIGLSMAGRATLPERGGITSDAKLKGGKNHKDQSRARREDRPDKRDKREGEEKPKKESEENSAEGRADKRDRREEEETRKKGSEKSSVETRPHPEARGAATEMLPAGPQPLSRIECEQAGRTWNEGTNTCG